MTKYFLKRLFLSFLALMIIAVIVYFLMGLMGHIPINEADYPNRDAYLADLKNLGLDRPLGERFLKYISDIFTGHGFGKIYQKALQKVSIPEIFFGPLIFTLWITLPAYLLSSFLGIGLGFLAGYKRGRWVDTAINVFVIFFAGVPSFVLAAFALFTGSILGLPTSFIHPREGYKMMLLSLVLPILVMTLTSLVTYTYFARNEIVSILSSNQVTIARAKGLDEWNVFKKHVLRNASIPLVSLFLTSFLILLSGSIVVETFFQVPGTSSIIVNAAKNSEYNIVMFQTFFFVSIGLLIGIIIDILYVFLDPRIKYSSASEFKFIKFLKAKITRDNLDQKKQAAKQKKSKHLKIKKG